MRLLCLLCGWLLAIACAVPAAAQVAPVPPSPELAAVKLRAADVRFLLDAVASGVTQVRAGELALERSHDPAVRELAQVLVHDHARANAQLLQIARDKGVAVPREPTAAQRGMLDALRGVPASAFDAQFLDRAGVHAHQEAIGLFHGQVLRADPDPQLKQFAESMLPVLEKHLRMAKAVAAHESVGASPSASTGDAATDAQALVTDAVQVVEQMKRDPAGAALLARAHGVLVLPHYGRVALGVGLRGGEGVLVTRHGEGFSDPAFYRLGGISIGLQAGVSGGDLVYLLMSDRAVQQFRSGRNFSLTADAGLTFGTYSAHRHATQGKLEDVIAWSGTRGAYAGGTVGISEVVPDQDANRAYYQHQVSPSAILGGLVTNPHNNVLGMVLAV